MRKFAHADRLANPISHLMKIVSVGVCVWSTGPIDAEKMSGSSHLALTKAFFEEQLSQIAAPAVRRMRSATNAVLSKMSIHFLSSELQHKEHSDKAGACGRSMTMSRNHSVSEIVIC